MSVIAFEVKQKILTLGRSEGLQKLLWQINNYSVKIRYWTFPMGKNSIFRLENRFSSARRECTVHSEGRANIGFWSGFQIVLLKYSYIFYTFINVCVIKKKLKKKSFYICVFLRKTFISFANFDIFPVLLDCSISCGFFYGKTFL